MKPHPFQHFKLTESAARAVRFLSQQVSVDAARKSSVVTLTRAGQFYDPRYGDFEITTTQLQQMVKNFDEKVYGQDIFIDRAHDANQGAAGTVNRIFLDGKKLRAEITWTPYGLELIQDKGYRYMSAEFHENFMTNEHPRTEHGAVLLGAALCVRPCIKHLDRVELAENKDFDGIVLISDQLVSQFSKESKVDKLIQLFEQALLNKKLKADAVKLYVAAAKKMLTGVEDEAQQQQMIGNLQEIALAQADSGTEPTVINLSMAAPNGEKSLTEEQVKALFEKHQQDAAKQLADDKKSLEDKIKLFTDKVNGTEGLSDDTKKKLLNASTLITNQMTDEQIQSLADNQIVMGQDLEAQKQLVGLGFRPGQNTPQGSVVIASGSNVNAVKLAEDVRKNLRLTSSFANSRIKLADKVAPFVDDTLQLFDSQYNHHLEAEYRVLSGDGNLADTELPYAFRREVIREALHDMTILALVQARTDAAAQATTQVPYEERKTHNALNNGIVYERGAIPTAGVTQKMDLAYVNAMKLAFNISNELMHFSRASAVNWDAWGRHVDTCSRILRELVVRRLANEMLRVSDSFNAGNVSAENVASQLNGSNSVIKTANFPVVRAHQTMDLAGNAVGSIQNEIELKFGSTVVPQFDGSGKQAAGEYWSLTNANLGYITLVDETGAAITPSEATATLKYSYSTNHSKFDIDVPAGMTVEKHLNGLLRKLGARKALMKDDRFESPDFLLMSNTLNDTCTNAEEFIYSSKRNGSDTNAMGDLEMVKAIPAYATNAPGIDLGDERILLGQRGTTSYTVAKAFALSEMIDGRDPTTGQLNGTKEAYGEEYNSIHTPKAIADRYSSVLVYSQSAR